MSAGAEQPPDAFTNRLAMYSWPSLVSAMARTLVYSLMRTRVAIAARPLSGLRWNTPATGAGFWSITRCTVRIWRSGVCGISATISIGTIAASWRALRRLSDDALPSWISRSANSIARMSPHAASGSAAAAGPRLAASAT